MENTQLAVGKRVKVSPIQTGFGEWQPGTIDKIEEFMGRLFVSVTYDHPTPDGRKGATITNLGLITPFP